MEQYSNILISDLVITVRSISTVIPIALLLGFLLGGCSSAIGIAMRSITPPAHIFGGVFTIVSIGFLIGHYASNGRDSAVADVAPILLSGAAAFFLLSFVQEKIEVIFAGAIALTFSIGFFSGSSLGAKHRELNEIAHLAALAGAGDAVQQDSEDDGSHRPPSNHIDFIPGGGK